MEPITVALIGIIVMVILLLLGMNIGFCMMLIGIVGYSIITNVSATVGLLRQIPQSTASNYTLVVIPLFIFMGNLAFVAGVSEGLFKAANKWLSRLPGGLACAAIAACAAFGAICGSAPATVATMGAVSIPAMREYGYNDKLSVGALGVGGTLGIMIPPSTPFIVYAIMAEQSIGRLFAAGIIPGIITALILMIFVVVMVIRNPALAPRPDTKYSLLQKIIGLKDIWGMAILFVIVLVGMFTGLFTVPEAAAIGAFAALLLTIINRKFSWKVFMDVIKDTLKSVAMIYVILIGASVFAKFLAVARLPAIIASFISGLAVSPYIIIFIIVLIYAIMGCFIDALPMIMLTVPIFLPIVDSLGFSPIWFGVLIVLVMQLGFITPPVGVCAYVISGVSKVPLATTFKGLLPFVPALIIAIIIVVFFPILSTWLPGLLY